MTAPGVTDCAEVAPPQTWEKSFSEEATQKRQESWEEWEWEREGMVRESEDTERTDKQLLFQKRKAKRREIDSEWSNEKSEEKEVGREKEKREIDR